MKYPSDRLKKLPKGFASDEELEHFVETVDLTEYDLSGFHPAQFVFEENGDE